MAAGAVWWHGLVGTHAAGDPGADPGVGHGGVDALRDPADGGAAGWFGAVGAGVDAGADGQEEVVGQFGGAVAGLAEVAGSGEGRQDGDGEYGGQFVADAPGVAGVDEAGEQGVEGGDDTRSGVMVDGLGVGVGDCHWWTSRSEMLCVCDDLHHFRWKATSLI